MGLPSYTQREKDLLRTVEHALTLYRDPFSPEFQASQKVTPEELLTIGNALAHGLGYFLDAVGAADFPEAPEPEPHPAFIPEWRPISAEHLPEQISRDDVGELIWEIFLLETRPSKHLLPALRREHDKTIHSTLVFGLHMVEAKRPERVALVDENQPRLPLG